MKKLLTVLAAVMAVAVSQFASAAVSVTISADKKTADFAFDASPLSRKLYLAYGNVDGGDSTNGWTFCSLLQTVPANTTALTGVTLPEGLGKTYRVMRAFLEKPMTAKDGIGAIAYGAADDATVSRKRGKPFSSLFSTRAARNAVPSRSRST